jgi:hypothetical protein
MSVVTSPFLRAAAGAGKNESRLCFQKAALCPFAEATRRRWVK